MWREAALLVVAVPNTKAMIEAFSGNKLETIFALTACMTKDGGDRSLSQKNPVRTDLLRPLNTEQSKGMA